MQMDQKFNSSRFLSVAGVLWCVVLLAFALNACAKKRIGETAEETKARKSAVYTAQAFVGIESWSDATEVLANGKQLSAETAMASYKLNERVRKIADQISGNIQAGKPADALGYIDRGIAEIETAERNGVFTLNNPAAEDRFYSVLAGVKIGLQSIRAVIEATKEPPIPEETKRALAVKQSNTQWWADLVALGERTAIKLWQLSRYDTAPAWAAASSTSAALASKNAARLGL